MTLGMRRTRRLILGIDLQNRGPGNDMLVIELSRRLGEHDVDLADGAERNSIDLVVLVAGRDADLDGELKHRNVKVSILYRQNTTLDNRGVCRKEGRKGSFTFKRPEKKTA